MNLARSAFTLSLFLTVAVSATTTAATTPIAVSPGSPRAALPVEASTPTFSWGAVEDTLAYEIVVYELDERGEIVRDEPPAIRATVPGAASSWTPSADEALTRDRQYAWSVRAIRKSDRTSWSLPSLFRVSPGISPDTVERLLEIVRRGGTDVLPALGEDEPTEEGIALESPEPSISESTVDSATEAALDGADFSIDSTGNVLGNSFGGDGSGLTNLPWDNLVGAPPGFADGTDDTGPAYAAGIQLELSGTTFNVLEGSGSGLDADLLDGLEAAAFALTSETYSAAEVDALLTIDNITAPTPGQPGNLRLTSNPAFPGMRRLWWNMDSLVGVASFIVYQADLPITESNKMSAQRRVTSSLYAPIDIYPGSGTQHFRVEAVNVLGEAGPLSDELAIDTTSRLLYRADQDANDFDEIYVVPATGGDSSEVSDPDSLAGTFDGVDDYLWSPDGIRVAYRAGNELFVVPATGGTATRVTDGAGNLGFQVAWSPDGSRLAFLATQDTPNVQELYVAAATGGTAVKVNGPLPENGDVSEFAWSPDGSRLAYLADKEVDNLDELYVVSAAGGGATKINDSLTAGGRVIEFSWSPDGTRLAYRADQDIDGVAELYAVPSTGGGSIKVNDPLPPSSDVEGHAWSPDGSRLAYWGPIEDINAYELFVAPASGGGAVKVSDSLVAGGNVEDDFAWSPDGSRLAYRADQDIEGLFELYVVSATGGRSIKVSGTITPGGDVDFFAWSPGGSLIAYFADQEVDGVDELFLASPSGTGATKANDSLVSGGDVYSFAWSPDGSRLAYNADQETNGILELFVVPVVGGGSVKVSDTLVTGGDVRSGMFWSPLGVD